MEGKVSDKDVLRLLSSLKNAHGDYPQDMIESRREAFAKQAAAMLVLMNSSGSGVAASGAGQSASTAATATGSSAAGAGGVSMGTILETALIVAIVAEAGIATYVYREKIAELFQSGVKPKVEQVSNPPDPSSINEPSMDDLDESPFISITETPYPTVTFTPVPDISEDTQPDATAGGSSETTLATSTPDPDDDNGLHLGQTKQPTKQPDNKKDMDKK